MAEVGVSGLREELRAHQEASGMSDGTLLDVLCEHLDRVLEIDDRLASELWEHVSPYFHGSSMEGQGER